MSQNKEETNAEGLTNLADTRSELWGPAQTHGQGGAQHLKMKRISISGN
jgi:hypothetical protein